MSKTMNHEGNREIARGKKNCKTMYTGHYMWKVLEIVKMLMKLINEWYSPFDLVTFLPSALVAFRGKDRLVFSFSLAGGFCFALAGPWGCSWSFPAESAKLFKLNFSLICQDILWIHISWLGNTQMNILINKNLYCMSMSLIARKYRD